MSNMFDKFFVDLTEPDHLEQIVEQLVQNGLATFEGVTSTERLKTLANSLGTVFVQDDTDEHGVKLVDPQAALAGSFFHTDRASMESPPNVIIVLCAKQSKEGGESIFVDGEKIYRTLKEDYPEALEAFSKPDSLHFGSGPYLSSGSIFNREPDGTVYIKFRYDKWGYFSAPLIKHVPTLLKLMDAYTISFRLTNYQGYIAQNGRWLHGARPAKGRERIIYRMILNCRLTLKNDKAVGFGFSSV